VIVPQSRLNIWSLISACIFTAVCLAALTACVAEKPEIVFGPSDPFELGSDDRHSYDLIAKAGQFVFGSVNQDSVDVVVTVEGPGGARIGRFDVSARGPEQVQFETGEAGTYRLVVSPYQQAEGTYSVGVFQQRRLADTTEEKIDQLMSRYSEDSPGGVVAVVRNGQIVFGRGYGLANVEYAVPNTVSTPYHMASISKQFTAMAIIILGQRGLLNLDDDIRQYLPEIPDFGVTITLRHLMNHTSGLRDQWVLWGMSGHLMDDVIRQEDLVRLIRRQKDLNFIPGSEFLYSNTGYMLLSEVVAAVSGQSFGDWMSENIFEPLGMSSTQIYDDYERIVPRRAYSYRVTGDGLSKAVLSYSNSGATSLITTAEDMAKWLANFDTGIVGGSQAIEMLQTQGILNSGATIDYALGLVVSDQNGLRRLAHAGSDAGFRTWLGYYPEIDAGVLVFGNVASFPSSSIGPAVADIFFAEDMNSEEREVNNTISETPENGAPDGWQPDALELAAYAGRYYSDELETFYDLAVEGDALTISHVRLGEFSLSPREEGAFESDAWFIGNVAFDSTNGDGISTMRVTNGRVRGLVFERVD